MLWWVRRGMAASVLAAVSEDQARLSLGIERPDRSPDLRVDDLAIVARQRPIRLHVDDAPCDRTERGHEVIGRFHDQDLPRQRIDADVGEQLEAERLGPLGDQYHLDTFCAADL